MSLPQTLADWRKEAKAWGKTKYQPYDLWRPLIPFFQNHGLALWETNSTYPGDGYFLIGPEGIERAPDGFSYLSSHFPDGIPELNDFFQQIVRHSGYLGLQTSKLILSHLLSGVRAITSTPSESYHMSSKHL